MTAAIFAAQAGAKSVVVEKNATAGRKLLLTGGGRCNLTHICSIDEFVRIYESGGRFLRHCLYEFSPDETLDFFSGLGVETKAEQDPSSLRYAGAGGCVFPASERAGDVRDALVKRCEELGVQFNFGRGAERVEKRDVGFAVFTGREIVTAQNVIIAAGGKSYPQTGSTGDGYKLAKLLGHTIIEPKAALVPLVAEGKWCAELAGTSLDKVKISAMVGGKPFDSAQGRKVCVTGPLVFTQDGIGRPAVLD